MQLLVMGVRQEKAYMNCIFISLVFYHVMEQKQRPCSLLKDKKLIIT